MPTRTRQTPLRQASRGCQCLSTAARRLNLCTYFVPDRLFSGGCHASFHPSLSWRVTVLLQPRHLQPHHETAQQQPLHSRQYLISRDWSAVLRLHTPAVPATTLSTNIEIVRGVLRLTTRRWQCATSLTHRLSQAHPDETVCRLSAPARAACEAQRYLRATRRAIRSRHELTSMPD